MANEIIRASLHEMQPLFNGLSVDILYIMQGYLDKFNYGNLFIAAKSLKIENAENSDDKKKNKAPAIKKDGTCKKDKLSKNPEDDKKEDGVENDNYMYNGTYAYKTYKDV